MHLNKTAKSILKYAVALVLLALVLRNAGSKEVLLTLGQIPCVSWLFALACVTGAQIVSAFRMRFFFRHSHFPLNARFALVLCYVGSFYNFLLPGGIGGDAYKVILARRRMAMPALQGIRIMIADRASGLCILMLMMALGIYCMDVSRLLPYAGVLLSAAAVITVVAYAAISKWFLRQAPLTMLASLPYSFVVQGLWLSALAIVGWPLGALPHIIEYSVLYCAASIAAMAPISVGGLGVKEMSYFYGATLIQHATGISVNPQLGVALSLSIAALMLVASLPGLLWLEKVADMEHA